MTGQLPLDRPPPECEVCGASTTELGTPAGYSPSFLRCCPPCRDATPRERVSAYLRRVASQFGPVLYRRAE